MRRVFSSKKQRKQAEEAILKDIRVIQERLDLHRAKKATTVDKAHIMSVLTQFVQLKKSTKIH